MIGSYSCCTYNDFHTFLDYKAFTFGHCVMVGQIYYRICRPDNDAVSCLSISTIGIFIVISIVIVSGSLSSIPVCNRVSSVQAAIKDNATRAVPANNNFSVSFCNNLEMLVNIVLYLFIIVCI